ncbi:hypothetical protein JD844_001762 [Phrynosoma platyrhinos]|uniref:Long-chain-fatty-acid--CoA ligase n=1 Tax=Phrynosoma platyrhinos TaxID=52577 RepID=A0ABQ7TAP3_PHRPL|nr:hypothetical protein JD844_001762 [Phrynosoma platyrhinos]
MRRCHKHLQSNPPIMLLDYFLEKVQKHPEKPFILFGEEVYSYQDVDRRSSQVARVLRDHVGLKEGETVAVFLQNVPAYVWVWMGLEKIGCTMACINYNIRSKSLLHVLSSCEAKVLLTTPGECSKISGIFQYLYLIAFLNQTVKHEVETPTEIDRYSSSCYFSCVNPLTT